MARHEDARRQIIIRFANKNPGQVIDKILEDGMTIDRLRVWLSERAGVAQNRKALVTLREMKEAGDITGTTTIDELEVTSAIIDPVPTEEPEEIVE